MVEVDTRRLVLMLLRGKVETEVTVRLQVSQAVPSLTQVVEEVGSVVLEVLEVLEGQVAVALVRMEMPIIQVVERQILEVVAEEQGLVDLAAQAAAE